MKFILISPLRKGAGASTLATNLSYCLSKKEERVLLVQADRAFTEIDVLLDLPKGEIPGWQTTEASLEDLVWQISPTLHYLPAGRTDTTSAANEKSFRTANDLIRSVKELNGVEWVILVGFEEDSLWKEFRRNKGIALYVVEPNSANMQALSEFKETDQWSALGTYCVVNKLHQQSRLEQDLVKVFRNVLQERFCPVVFGFDEIALRAALRKEVLCQNFSFTELGQRFLDFSTWVKLQFLSGNPERAGSS